MACWGQGSNPGNPECLQAFFSQLHKLRLSFGAIPIKCFVSHRPVSCDGGSVGRSGKKKKNEWVLEGDWVPEKAGMLSKEAWLQSQLENVVFSAIKCLNNL